MQETPIKNIEWKGKEYPLVFNLNVMEKIQDEYKTFKNWSDLVENSEETNIKALKFAIKEMINEGLEIKGETCFVSEKDVGRLLTDIGIKKATQAMQEVVIESSNIEENSKNV